LAKEDKAQKVKELAGEIKDANLVVVTDFSSFDVKSLRALRIRLRENQTSYRVVKNNILRRAFKEVGVAEMEEHLTGPNAIAVAGGDAAGALQEMSAFLKENTEAVKAKRERGALFLKVGLLDGKFVDSQGLIALSLLPSREVMLGILAATLQAPISGLARALNGIICSLAFALKDLVGKGGAKQGTADAVDEKKEEVTEEKAAEKTEEKTEETERRRYEYQEEQSDRFCREG
jgi:large subunit ribosomal protein L10